MQPTMYENTTQSQRRLARNTAYLYLRTFFVMIVGLYTTRVVLHTLGIIDYGIYNLVGGFVAMFSLLSSTLTTATQRFLTYELGKSNSNVNKVFSMAVTTHIILALIIAVLFETLGLWYLNTRLSIDEGMIAANWVFHCSVATFLISLISVPYNALIVAHERMGIFASFSIYEAIAKLAIVFML